MSVAVLRSALVLGATGWLWLDAAPHHVASIRMSGPSLPTLLDVEELHVWGLSTSPTRLAKLGIRKSTLQLERGEAP